MWLGDPRRWISCGVSQLALTFLMGLASLPMCGQSLPPRTRAAELTAFGMFTSLTPDYGPYVNPGFTIGGSFTKLMKFTSISLEGRYKNAPGVGVGERTVGGGPRFEYRWTRIHLYADLFASTGTITFANKNDRGSNGTGYNGSVVYTYGGGVDYDISGQWAARFDAQSEHWDLEEKPRILLAPSVLSVGIVYRLRFPRDRSRWESGWNADLRGARLKR
jgi:hypothetical protein